VETQPLKSHRLDGLSLFSIPDAPITPVRGRRVPLDISLRVDGRQGRECMEEMLDGLSGIISEASLELEK
jgi:hypothetical protein